MEERLDLARPENTLRKLLTAFVFYKAFGSNWRRSARWRSKAAFEGQIKEENCDQNVNLLKKRNTWCFGLSSSGL
jgi:hypothetical protein